MRRPDARGAPGLPPGTGWRVGVDTGGTNTDLGAFDGRDLRVAKVPSTPPNYEQGVIDAIAAAGIDVADISILAHGTTVATNATITREGAPAALLTTRGFRDVLELRRHNRGDMYDIAWDPPQPLIPRRRRFEVTERVDYAGRTVTPLDESDVEAAVDRAWADGVRSFAICFLHSYANPDHERRAKEIVQAMRPDAYVYASSDLVRQPGEFERTSTVAVNAYLGPVVADYLEALQRGLESEGFRGKLYVMHSGGGLLTARTAVLMPARLVASGPAAGAMAARGVVSARRESGSSRDDDPAARGDVISLDVGGTSADIAVIRGGVARSSQEYDVEFGIPIRFPAVDVTFIGAGGGSIASVDAGGLPLVGPRSAGASPGPAAYGRGGIEPTVTDANVVLSRLTPDAPLAGGITLDVAAARAAVERFATAIRRPLDEAALGIIRIANGNMARAIRLVTIERGLDPRRFALMAFGGAGGLLSAELAEILDIDTVIVPVAPGVTSALGCLCVAVAHEVVESFVCGLSDLSDEEIGTVFERLEAAAGELLDIDGVEPDDREVTRFADMRYVGQIRSVTLPVGEGMTADRGAELRASFLAEYERSFFHAPADIPIEVAALRVRARAVDVPAEGLFAQSGGHAGGELDIAAWERQLVGTTQGAMEAVVGNRSQLPEGASIPGPAVLHQDDSTTWVPPGWRCLAEPGGLMTLRREREESR